MNGGFDVQERLQSALPELERTLRVPAISAVAMRCRLITAEAIEDDQTLAVALVRVALAAVGRGPRSDSTAGDSSEPPARDDRAEILAASHAEHDLRRDADNRDQALVALAAARYLVERLDSDGEDLDRDTLVEVALGLAEPGHDRLIRERALELVHRAASTLPEHERQICLGVEGLRALRAYALGEQASGFVRATALDVFVGVVGSKAASVLSEVLQQREGRDLMLVRRRAVRAIPQTRMASDRCLALAELAGSDPSEHVRQGLAATLREIGTRAAYDRLGELVRSDGSPRVAGVALLELERAAHADRGSAQLLCDVLVEACRGDALVQRTALAVFSRLGPNGGIVAFDERFPRAVTELIESGPGETAEQGALLLRRWEIAYDAGLSELSAALTRVLEGLALGKKTRFAPPGGLEPRALERVLCVCGAEDYPIAASYSKGIAKLTRGERKRTRWWRLQHELLHPAPDKRQNYLHGQARSDRADAITIPLGLAEVTPTRVPGERRTTHGQSWAGFLPRVDDVLFACERGRPRRLLTVFGTLVLEPPASALARFRARWSINLRYAALAELRERSLRGAADSERRAYMKAVRRLGLRWAWEQTAVSVGGTSVESKPAFADRYFSVLLPLPVTLWVEDAIQYVLMPTGNTAWHLALVVWVLLSVMVARSAWVLSRFEVARENIPLTLGGWGSRGKSGTERLKAALFHAQHYDVVSKTTGCEAMIILARRGEPASEIFLHRPYDKATIWEQAQVVEYARALDAQVFLWECMALQPEFVDILNHEWMRDRVTTITNAYPDHEDVMGPSGEDVANTIAQFIPRSGTILSSEDQMRPVLLQAAREFGSEMIDVSGLEADLLPRDVLARFPYEEHPRNIALVLRLAERLGIDRERALFDVADYVVPDLGVLKSFPVVEHKQRRMVFSNGMSANERAGFMSNWNRLGFAAHRADAEPGRWLVAVVNNRADRVPRSRVFAELLARDVALDAIVVIGTNQQGMKRFLEEAIGARGAEVESLELAAGAGVSELVDGLWDELGAPREAASVLQRVALIQTAVVGDGKGQACLETLKFALEAVAEAAPTDPEAIERTLEQIVTPYSSVIAAITTERDWRFAKKGADVELRSVVSTVVRPWLERLIVRGWFERVTREGKPSALPELRRRFERAFVRKVHVLEDSAATGDQVIDFIARQLPPGLECKLLGCQNIKGTGLDFVYRFMSIGRVSEWLRTLDESPEERGAVLRQMIGHVDYGLFDTLLVLEHLFPHALEEPGWAEHASLLKQLRASLEKLRDARQDQLTAKPRTSVLDSLLGLVEPFVDHLDAMRRRHRALRTMRDLVAGDIAQARAVEQMRVLTARQKGGWLAKDVAALFSRSR
jgi:poly-gamma-glutamate synthase PgsB/CapB